MLALLPLSAALLAAGDQPWIDKQASEWTEGDAKQVLTDSPWVKTVKPEIARPADNGQRRSGGGMGRGGGIGIGGIGIGLPGGIGRRGGMGYPGGGYPGGGYPGGDPRGRGPGGNTGGDSSASAPELKLRWESALPVREAELKARETNAPTIDESHYAIAVYGVPARMAEGGARSLADRLKKEAFIKREGKKDLKPSSVEILQREDGPVFVYLFPRSKEISRNDKGLEFNAQIARLKFAQTFLVDEMIYHDKLEL
jgi:hypothetical protein